MVTFVLCILLIIINQPPTILSVDYSNGNISGPFTFYLNDSITSYNTLVQLSMQNDGNFVLNSRSSLSDPLSYAGWDTNTQNSGDHAVLQNDGELSVFNASGEIIWTSNSITGTAPFRLIVSDDIAAYILDSSNDFIWSTNPSFSSLETIWFDTFVSNDGSWVGWPSNDGITLPSTSANCPNANDACLQTTTSDVDRGTPIVMYSAIQFQVDIRGCEIWWYIYNWTQHPTLDGNQIYKDVIVDIPLPPAYSYITVSFGVIYGTESTDICYFDNAILRGSTFGIMWSDTMDNNDNNNWETWNQVTFGEYTQCTEGSCALTAASNDRSFIVRHTNVSDYIDISLQVDLTAEDLETNDLCRISWRYGQNLFMEHRTDYTADGTYNNQKIAISDPGNQTVLEIRLQTDGDSSSGNDRCYWDNVVLRGTLVTEAPTKYPTLNPTEHPTLSPTKYPTRSPTKQPTLSKTLDPAQSPINIPTSAPTITSTITPTIDLFSEQEIRENTVVYSTDTDASVVMNEQNNHGDDALIVAALSAVGVLLCIGAVGLSLCRHKTKVSKWFNYNAKTMLETEQNITAGFSVAMRDIKQQNTAPQPPVVDIQMVDHQQNMRHDVTERQTCGGNDVVVIVEKDKETEHKEETISDDLEDASNDSITTKENVESDNKEETISDDMYENDDVITTKGNVESDNKEMEITERGYEQCSECGAISEAQHMEMKREMFVCNLCKKRNENSNNVNKDVDKILEHSNSYEVAQGYVFDESLPPLPPDSLLL